MDKYNVLSFIGEGSFGRVFKVRNKETDGIFALKVIRKKGRSTKDLKNLRQECDIQQHLRHPNIILMIESFDTDTELVVVTEFAEKDLHGVLGKEGCLQEAKAQVLTWDLISAMYYLHSHRVLHRDLKPQNVLIDAKGTAKLCDFGLARNMTTGTHVLTSIKGTPLYMAPELIDEKPYDHQADLWSLGCIVYEMIAGQPPFSTSSFVQLVHLIRHRPVQWPTFVSDQVVSFLQGLLHKDPALRFSWQEILIHPFVSGHILILNEQSPTESPFTQPLSQSQKAAKQLQKERLNTVQNLMPHAVQILERREQLKMAANKPIGIAEGVAVSDDDSIRVVSAISMRDSLRTDDEEGQLITGAHADLLKHEYNVLNQDNLIISNLNSNIAQLAFQPRGHLAVVNENKELDSDKNIVPEKGKDAMSNIEVSNKNSDLTEDKKEMDEHNDVSKRKLSQNLDNFSIRLKSFSKKENESQSGPVQTASNTYSGKPVTVEKETGLSRSVPPSYKQKILQFSRDKLGFGSGNKLTRSLKKSFNFKNIDKEKPDKGRRMSEPAQVTAARLRAMEQGKEEFEKVDDNESEKAEEEPTLKVSENLKLCDINSNDGQNLIDDDSTPIEKDEWLAFMKSNMKEVLEGDVESLTQQNIVSMVVGVARHAGAGSEVRGSLAALLSLPLVAPHVPRQTISTILKVYLEVKLVPNLVYAARLLIRQSAADNNSTESLVKNLSNEEMIALCRLTELTTQLCLRGAPFVQQLCDAVAVLNTAPLLAQYLSLHEKRLRMVLNTVTMLTVILQDLPENAELVESVLFEGECVEVCDLLSHPSDTLRVRVCVLIGLLGRYCCSALCSRLGRVWGTRQRETLEKLQTHHNDTLARAAKCAIRDLSKLPFYKQTAGVR